MFKTNKIIFWLLIILLALLPFHAFLITFINSLFFNPLLPAPWFLSIWKELIILAIFLAAIPTFFQNRSDFIFDRLDFLILSFFGLGILLIITMGRDWYEVALGIKYDFIFLFLFLCLKHLFFTTEQKELILKTIFGATTIMIGFGIITYFFAPPTFLTWFGYYEIGSFYNANTPLPFCHYIGNTHTCRLQSTLASPNHLASYLLIIIPLLITLSLRHPQPESLWSRFINFFRKPANLIWNHLKTHKYLIFLFFFTLLALFLTYSRSAWLGLMIEIIILTYFLSQNKKHFWQFVSLLSIGFAAIITILIIFNSSFFSTHLFREASSSLHFEKTLEGLTLITKTPFGLGLGRAGPASGRIAANYSGLIPENWYIQIALELGILGLIIFILILYYTLQHYYTLCKSDVFKNMIPLSLFIILIAISSTAFFLHSWESSPTALTCWGLLGIYYKQKE